MTTDYRNGQYYEGDDVVTVSLIEYSYADPHWEEDPTDSWDRADTFTELSGVEAYAGKRDGGYGDLRFKSSAKPGDKVYVVLVTFSTGDTFGRDTGHTQAFGGADDEETANRMLAFATGSEDFSGEFEGMNYHRDFVGYFECVDGSEVRELVVR